MICFPEWWLHTLCLHKTKTSLRKFITIIKLPFSLINSTILLARLGAWFVMSHQSTNTHREDKIYLLLIFKLYL